MRINFFITSIVLLTTTLSLIIGCYWPVRDNIYEQNEIVLKEGMSVTATNSLFGTMIITAGKGLERSYTWAGDTRTVTMWPRKDRWHGSLGIYYPGPGPHWKEHDRITRGVLNEGYQNFNSMESLLEYIQKYEDRGTLTYNDSGLFVSWHKTLGAGGTLYVTVWQFMINGHPPIKIPGSQNDQLIITTN
jgi:hypothetical protein